MKKFLTIYHAPVQAMEQMTNATQEQKDAGMQQWMDWKAANESLIFDFGAPVMPTTSLGGQTNSPTISGYSILQAESIEQLKDACQNHPHKAWHPKASIQICEFVPM